MRVEDKPSKSSQPVPFVDFNEISRQARAHAESLGHVPGTLSYDQATDANFAERRRGQIAANPSTFEAVV